jgi:hypothetical protein
MRIHQLETTLRALATELGRLGRPPSLAGGRPLVPTPGCGRRCDGVEPSGRRWWIT